MGGGRRSEGGGETGGRTKVRVRKLEGRKLSGGRKGEGREGMYEGVGMMKGGREGWRVKKGGER